ncbi:MAG: formyltetrahydrofolate deformylase [Deltaproteobacteria bacterium]|nr:formyltetrahydrofolate deformylase [Deltaproteobacteria bacterium]
MGDKAPIVTALIQGKDTKGIIATITNWIFDHGGNIVYLDQHTDPVESMFFMRIRWDMDGFEIPREDLDDEFSKVCWRLGMAHRLFFSDRKQRIAIMVSRQGHCLLDLLYRWRSGHLQVDIPCIISNHEDQRDIAGYYHVPFHCFPVTKDNKKDQEQQVMELLRKENIDTIVLARYMQILSSKFVNGYRNSIINIHHSFLPAFVGADPYRQAFMRGVKIIGATSHYITEKLDQGPIIFQDVVPVTHRDSVITLKRKGLDIEKMVLARAVGMHVENRVLIHNGKTVVFGG